MASLIDHEAVAAEFEAWLVEDGRPSHGTDFILRKLAQLRAKHTVDEMAEDAFMRRFGGHLSDSFFSLVPVTDDPLVADDPSGTLTAMSGGAESDHKTDGKAQNGRQHSHS